MLGASRIAQHPPFFFLSFFNTSFTTTICFLSCRPFLDTKDSTSVQSTEKFFYFQCIILYFDSFDIVVLRGLLVLRYNLLSRSDTLLKNMHEVKRLWCNKLQFRAPHAGGRVPNCLEDRMKMLFHKMTELILPGGSVKEKWQFAPRN